MMMRHAAQLAIYSSPDRTGRARKEGAQSVSRKLLFHVDLSRVTGRAALLGVSKRLTRPGQT